MASEQCLRHTNPVAFAHISMSNFQGKALLRCIESGRYIGVLQVLENPVMTRSEGLVLFREQG